MKKLLSLMLALTLALAGCHGAPAQTDPTGPSAAPEATTVPQTLADPDTVAITLDGSDVYVEEDTGVYTDNDIVYYEAGHDYTYGEGEPGDEHEASEAAMHTVVHITRPGVYRLTGSLDAGQIAVDLGTGARKDSCAVVTLILDGVDITCTVAPAIIFYNVYECAARNAELAGPVVDTSAAGANVVIADGSVNTVSGSYVAEIYDPGRLEIDEDGEIEEAEKLHKYDGAFYSRMSMNIYGGEAGDGVLTIHAENEGMDSERHLTINGGNLTINSGNDGINTNEDGVSVTTINGGNLTINVLGTTGEGDGIDSNGWLVINGGTVVSSACGFSGDAGLDSDRGIYLNGGTVIASGHMLDDIAGGTANWVVFQFDRTMPGGTAITMKDTDGAEILRFTPVNDFSTLVFSGDALVPGEYTLWADGVQMGGVSGAGKDFHGRGPGFERGPGKFEGEPPEGDYQIPEQPGDRTHTQGGMLPPGAVVSDDTELPNQPGGELKTPGEFEQMRPGGDYQVPEQPGVNPEIQGGGFGGQRPGRTDGEIAAVFVIRAGGNYFRSVSPVMTEQ